MSDRSHATEFDFGDLKIIEIPVVGPIGKKKYVLREATEEAAARFANARAKCAKFKDGGISGVDGLGDMPRFLLHLTLFNTNDDGSPNLASPILPAVLAKWPTRAVKPLFAESLKISEIDDDQDLAALKKEREKLDERIAKLEEDTVKNVPSDTESSSSLPESEDMAAPSST